MNVMRMAQRDEEKISVCESFSSHQIKCKKTKYGGWKND
jgi:hypothetical protein